MNKTFNDGGSLGQTKYVFGNNDLVITGAAAATRSLTVHGGDAPITIFGDDGRLLLQIKGDGSVIGEATDASEAAEVFVREMKKILGPNLPATNTDAP